MIGNSNPVCLLVPGVVESDMELDMMNGSDSDSEESTRSHADNASIQRSAITAATAGSDAGLFDCLIVEHLSLHLHIFVCIHFHLNDIYTETSIF